jgi:aryl-alcohol dehydrogenase-like predicted oxidoreductase
MQECDPDVCLLASQYSLIEHANALNNVFPVAGQRNVKFVIGSSLNAGFISGSPRYNYGKTSWNIPRQYIEKRAFPRTIRWFRSSTSCLGNTHFSSTAMDLISWNLPRAVGQGCSQPRL